MMNLILREREAPALSRRDALARPASFNAEARTVEAIVATTTPVPVGNLIRLVREAESRNASVS